MDEKQNSGLSMQTSWGQYADLLPFGSERIRKQEEAGEGWPQPLSTFSPARDINHFQQTEVPSLRDLGCNRCIKDYQAQELLMNWLSGLIYD